MTPNHTIHLSQARPAARRQLVRAGDTAALDRAGAPGNAAPTTTRFAFALFIAVNAALYIRPTELIPEWGDLHIYEVLIVLALAASLGPVVWQLRVSSLRARPITVCVVGLLGVAVLQPMLHLYVSGAIYGGTVFLKLVLYYLLCVANLSSVTRIRQFMGWLAFSALVLAAFSILTYHGVLDIAALVPPHEWIEGQIDPITGNDAFISRLTGVGIFDNPNDMARLMDIGLIISGWFVIEWRSFLGRLICVGMMGVFGYALFRTSSRGAFLGLLAGLLAFLLMRVGVRKAVPLAVVAVPVLFVLFASRITNIDTSGGSGQGRIQLWGQGFPYFFEAPIFGIGMDEINDRINSALHNTLLQYYIEMGLVGGSFCMGALVIPIREMVRMKPSSTVMRDRDMRGLRALIVALTVGYAVGLLSCNKPYAGPTYGIFAMGASYVALAKRRFAWPALEFDVRFGRWLAGVGFGILVIFYIYVRVSVHWSGQ